MENNFNQDEDENKKIKKLSKEIFDLLYLRNEEAVMTKIFQMEMENIDLTLLIDDDHINNTLLTTTIYLNMTRLTLFIIRNLKGKIKDSIQFIAYLNKKNENGFNAILYSCFRGNYKIFEKLIELGADINSTNKSGLNVLHLAAQSNCPNIIASLIEKYNFNINSLDNEHNSALHSAVFMDSKEAIDYLIYYKIDLKIEDIDGDTALSLVSSKANKELTRHVYNYIKSNSNFNNITSFFKINKLQLFNILKNKLYSLIFFPFVTFLVISEALNLLILIKVYENLLMFIVYTLFSFLQIFFYYAIKNSKNGNIVTSGNKNSILFFLEQNEDLKEICPWCKNFIDQKTIHCFFCNKCVKNKDFHNLFLNSCICKKNFRLYMSYLLFMFINQFSQLLFIIWIFIRFTIKSFDNKILTVIKTKLFFTLILVICVPLQMFFKIQNHNDKCYNDYIERDSPSQEMLSHENGKNVQSFLDKTNNNLDSSRHILTDLNKNYFTENSLLKQQYK